MKKGKIKITTIGGRDKDVIADFNEAVKEYSKVELLETLLNDYLDDLELKEFTRYLNDKKDDRVYEDMQRKNLYIAKVLNNKLGKEYALIPMFYAEWGRLMSAIDEFEGFETEEGYFNFRINIGETTVLTDEGNILFECDGHQKIENTFNAVYEFAKYIENTPHISGYTQISFR